MNANSPFSKVFGTAVTIIGVVHLFGKDSAKDHIRCALEDSATYLRFGIKHILIENYDFGLNDENIFFELGTVLESLHSTFNEEIIFGVKTKSASYSYLLGYESRGASFVQVDHLSGDISKGYIEPFEHLGKYQGQRTKHPEMCVLGGIHPSVYLLPDEGSLPARTVIDSIIVARDLCDAVVLTGGAVRYEVKENKLIEARKALGPNTPLVIGSGVSDANITRLIPFTNVFIVGSYFRENGVQHDSRLVGARIEKLLDKINPRM